MLDTVKARVAEHGAMHKGRRAIPASLADDGLLGDLPNIVPAAVLVPLIDRAGGATVLLTQRTDHLSDHAGQISFPGGRVEPGDIDVEATALRETEEEVGLPRDRVDVIGRLDTCLTGTGFSVVPVVGLVSPPFDLILDSFEVAEAFEVPLAFVLDPDNHQRRSAVFRDRRRAFFVIPYQDRYIWGATARMLVNLYEIVTGDAEKGPA